MDLIRKTLDYVDNALDDVVVSTRQDAGKDDAECLEAAAEEEEAAADTTDKKSFWDGIVSRRHIADQVTAATTGNGEFKKEIDKLKATISQLKRQVADKDVEIKELFNEGLKFSQEAGHQNNKAVLLQQKLNEAERTISKCNQRIEELTENNLILNETVTQLSVDGLNQSDAEIRELKLKLSSNAETIESLEKVIASNRKEIECLKIEVEAGMVLRSRCHDLEIEVSDLRSVKRSLRKEFERCSQLEISLSNLQLESQKKIQSLETDILRYQTHEVDRDRISGDECVINTLMEQEILELKEKLQVAQDQSKKYAIQILELQRVIERNKDLFDQRIQHLKIELEASLQKEQESFLKERDELAARNDSIISDLRNQLMIVQQQTRGAQELVGRTDESRGSRDAKVADPFYADFRNTPPSEQPSNEAINTSKESAASANEILELKTHSREKIFSKAETQALPSCAMKVAAEENDNLHRDFADSFELDSSSKSRVEDLSHYQKLVKILRNDLDSERREKNAYRGECLRLSDEIELMR
eukprot:Gregarina_sp_Poly_1__4607@NODE_2468_length_2082_cov_52_044665_g1563_i0_p1_GENE_NODE_2468_length_2082_cov_52_044665_g1563_i0NODE_2468_length_2082_cov_52_044665_g1563_i0_p1_ORF_typecomplete_len533_score114_78TMF_DNA_bd/PF12329_8/67TMF_DNA_bd/PF12329_8/3_9e06TMF_DNA_bd/PF12329_8/8_8TMF_DNA_bd/PF12329_8/1_8e04TMF_DNA_bd/PF12329_8/9_5e02MAD/PF05557_13/2_8e05MAD/PF05557_13/1_8e04HAUS5/PF14817_6/0_007HAUS5/PF14817_6/6_1e03HAUS5/PF14817_6/1_8e04CENPF_leu_zip/PF10473_9/1_5CENPF_leu_zip/PF10473_9/1_1e02CE